jgi:hypothetical protein
MKPTSGKTTSKRTPSPGTPSISELWAAYLLFILLRIPVDRIASKLKEGEPLKWMSVYSQDVTREVWQRETSCPSMIVIVTETVIYFW